MAHIHDKIDFTASVLIVRDGSILLHKHKKLGVWLMPGGHIELDEDPNEAAVREAKEETGLDVELIGYTKTFEGVASRELIVPRFLNRHYFNAEKTHEHIDFGYIAKPIAGEVRPEEEDGEIRWFTRDEIERNEIGLYPDVRMHALVALDESR